MNDSLKVGGGVLLGALLLFVTGGLTKAPVVNVQVPEQEQNVGGASPEQLSYFRVHGVFTQGGRSFATTSAPASTLLGSSISDASIVRWTGAAPSTMTTPASTTVPGIDKVGMCRQILIENEDSADNLTLSAGTGVTFSTVASTSRVLPGKSALTVWCREADTDIEVVIINAS
jgi:hypothetical protein